jgi:signal peptidase I
VTATLRVARFTTRALAGLVFAVCIAVLAAVALSTALGMRSFTVMSGSMEPSIHTGDVVIDQRIEPLRAHVGDVVTFTDPSNRRRLITHRVRSIRPDGNTVQVVTKGDANNTVERWSVPVDGRIGLVKAHVPKLGYLLVYSHSRYGLVLLVALPALVLCLLQLRLIWMPRKEDAGHAAAG